MRLVIIGLGPAGFAALLTAKRFKPNIEIVVVDSKEFDLFHPCGLPFYLEGKIPVEQLKHELNMNVKIIHKKVKKINIKDKFIQYDNKKISYDKLIIATGSLPSIPNINITSNKVFTLHSIDDAIKINSVLDSAKKIVIVGAGAIGLEVANALLERKKRVYVIELLSHCFANILDEDMAKLIEDYLIKKGVSFFFNSRVEKINNHHVYLTNNKIDYDLVILATGVKPNIEIVLDSGIKTSRHGIIVNERMETSVKDVFAAGDCVRTIHFITKKECSIKTATVAYQQGIIAGINAVGGDLKYKGTIGTFVSKIGELEVAGCGLNSLNAKSKFIIAKSRYYTQDPWVPTKKELILKVLVNSSGNLIGAQAIGSEALHRINILSTLILNKINIKKVGLELGYCPIVAPVYDILHQVIDLAVRKLRKNEAKLVKS